MTKKFYCDESLKADDKDKTDELLSYAFGLADHVEFNILYTDEKELEAKIKSIKDDLIDRGKRFDKIYNGTEYIRFKLTDKVKDFVRKRGIIGWTNTQLEDISFLRQNFEFLATISHENYIILQMTEDEKNSWSKKGFNFEFDWGIDAREEKV
jgi:DNA gyrase/topoisomerase IV subunit A